MSSSIGRNSKESHFEGRFRPQVYSTLWKAYRSFWLQLLLFLSFGFVGRLFLLGNANVIGYWVDSFCQGELGPCRSQPAFFQGYTNSDFMTLLVAMTVVGFFLTWIFRVGFSRVSALAVSSLYDETTWRTSRYPMQFFDQTPTGRVVTRFSSDYGNVFRLFGGPLAEFASIIFDLLGMILLTTIAGPIYLPLLLVMALLNYLVFRVHRNRLRQARRALSASRSPSVAHFSETAQGANAVRSFNRQDSFEKRFFGLDRLYLDRKNETLWLVFMFSASMSALAGLLLLVLAGTAQTLVTSGWLSVGSIGVAFGFVLLSSNTVQMFFEWLAQFEEAMVGVERMDEYLRLPMEPGALLPLQAKLGESFERQPELTRAEERLPSQESPPPTSGVSVEIKDLSFRYRDDLPWVLRNLNFSIGPGEKFGIVGKTGSGKSSIIQALFHLYPIDEGSIRIGNYGFSPKGPEGAPIEEIRSQMTLIPQDPTLFRGTLRENLSLESRNPKELIAALEKVGLSSWATPAGLEKIVEERGRNFSLGERQLVCMARCLLSRAPLVVLDESTASVDPTSEEAMVAATAEIFRDRTVILIAHRLSTLLECHRVLWLDQGSVRAIGKPSEILPEFERASGEVNEPKRR